MENNIIVTAHFEKDLTHCIQAGKYDKVFILTDEVSHLACMKRIENINILKDAQKIIIPSGEIHKNLDTLSMVWSSLQSLGASRHSLLINIGGGVITDLGGFAAATFKRGIDAINIPTTLLAMVDASIGGKTGINFKDIKNEIGAFYEPQYVIIYTEWLQTLDEKNILSGYAEMLKHALLSDSKQLATILSYTIKNNDWQNFATILEENLQTKANIVAIDPLEKGIRKALNLGHTFGHAFETWAMQRQTILHGYAVAYGLVCELYLSVVKCNFPIDKMRQVVQFIFHHYGKLNITCDDYEALINLMRHDKKNKSNAINVSLLSDIGKVEIDHIVSEEEIKEALDFFREA